jgi:TRAP-type C4-dicarboxylate transport system permease small subunit
MFNNNENNNENVTRQINPFAAVIGVMFIGAFMFVAVIVMAAGKFVTQGIPWMIFHPLQSLLGLTLSALPILIIVFAVRFVLRLWANRPSS